MTTIPKTEPETLTKREALAIMEDAGGHAWLTPSAGEKIARAFGLAIAPSSSRANTGEHKGLEVPGVPANTIVRGYSCVTLAVTIAEHLFERHTGPGVLLRTYTHQEGRGSRAHSACELIAAALDATGE